MTVGLNTNYSWYDYYNSTISSSSGTDSETEAAALEAEDDSFEKTTTEDSEAIEEAEAAEETAETTATAETTETEETTATDSTSSTSDVEETEEMTALREEIEELEEQKEENEAKMEKIEAQIEKLSEEVSANIAAAVAAQEEAAEEYEEETKAAINENIEAYIEANKEGGDGMTRAQLYSNIESSMPNQPGLADAAAALLAASEGVNEIDAYLDELNTLIYDTQDIQNQIDANQSQYDALAEACAAADTVDTSDADTSDATTAAATPTVSQGCEPQGFQTSDGTQYDFFIDTDGNGELSNETEFLGYEGGQTSQEAAWAEMTDLDTDGDGLVSADELTAGGVMVYVTNTDGTQTAMTIEEAFGEDSDLAISTTQDEEAVSGVGPNNFDSGTGSEKNELWGTFDVTLNGETLKGYQTNDDLDWLKENYDFTDYASSDADASGSVVTGDGSTSTSGLDASLFSEDLQSHVNFFNEYTEKSAAFKEEINELYADLGVTDDNISGIYEATAIEATANVNNFFATLTEANEEEEEEEEEIDDTVAA